MTSLWPDSDETQQLLRQAQAGGADAVNQLMERHRESLRHMIQARMDRAVAGRIDASDIVQDVLLEASQRLNEYVRDPRLPFQLWLRHLAKDRLVDMHRRHRLAQRRSVDREQSLAATGPDLSSVNLAGLLADRELTPAAATLRREFERRFLAALDQLEEEDREILLMRHYEQLSNSEVAEILGVSQPAAGMRHLRALRRLRQVLGEEPSSG